MPVIYPGDPVIRGLQRLPSMMSATDVRQGAANDTRAAEGLQSATEQFNTFRTMSTGSSSPGTGQIGSGEFTGNGDGVDWGKVGKGIIDYYTGGNNTGGDDAANSAGASDMATELGGCKDVSFLAHPLIVLNCLLDRTLFGLVALVLIGFGLYLFAKD